MTQKVAPKPEPKAVVSVVTPTAPVTAPVVSEKSLMASLQTALAAGNFKLVAQVSQELVKYQRTQEQAAADAKSKALLAVTLEVKTALDAAVKKLVDAKKLDLADGVWYSQDFGDKSAACRLIKATAKAERKSSGGGVGKKFSIGTAELLQKYGGMEYKDGQTFQQTYEADSDKNFRFGIRNALLKLEGLIT